MDEPAFPLSGVGTETFQFNGMTLRDYFAAKAIRLCFDHCTTNERAAVEAYKVADAMLAAREKTE